MHAIHRGILASLALLAAGRGASAADITLEVRDFAGKPVAEAVVYAMAVNGAPTPATSARAIIDQVNKEFVPRVSIVQAGTQVFFPNSDNIRHSIYSFSPAKTFTTKLYSGREAAPVVFDKSGLVVLGCNIHDTMVAWVYIVDTPWFARSDKDGVGTMRTLPPGDYVVHAAAPQSTLKPATVSIHVGSAPIRQSISLEAGS